MRLKMPTGLVPSLTILHANALTQTSQEVGSHVGVRFLFMI